jgi:hypothetical protein
VLAALDVVLRKINTRTRERETMLLLNKLQPAIVWRSTPLDLMLSKSEVLKYDSASCSLCPKKEASSARAEVGEEGSLSGGEREDRRDDKGGKGNWAGIFNNIFLVCRFIHDRYYEVCSFPVKGLCFSASSDGLLLPLSLLLIASRYRRGARSVSPGQARGCCSCAKDPRREAPLECRPHRRCEEC